MRRFTVFIALAVIALAELVSAAPVLIDDRGQWHIPPLTLPSFSFIWILDLTARQSVSGPSW